MNNESIALIQWLNNGVLSDTDLMLDNVPTFNSVYDIEMNWMAPPESTNSDSGLDLTLEESGHVFAPYDEYALNATVPNTLLNPDNMYHFYYEYNFGSMSDLAKWLGIPENQLGNLKTYLDWLINQNEISIYGTTLAKSIQSSIDLLVDHLPLELGVRTMAAYNH